MATQAAFLPSPRGRSRTREIDALIARIASRQRGQVARRQLLAAGIGRRAIENRIRTGMLIPRYPGVYSVGHRNEGRLAAMWAARLHAGPGARFCGRSAGELWRLLEGQQHPLLIATPRSLRSRPGLRLHQMSVPADELGEANDLPVSIPSRTLLELASEVGSDRDLELVLERCEREELGDHLGIDGILSRYPGRRGAGRLRRVWERWRPGEAWTNRALEDLFVRFLDEHGIARGVANAWIETGIGPRECAR